MFNHRFCEEMCSMSQIKVILADSFDAGRKTEYTINEGVTVGDFLAVNVSVPRTSYQTFVNRAPADDNAILRDGDQIMVIPTKQTGQNVQG